MKENELRYQSYLLTHISNVRKAYILLLPYLKEMFDLSSEEWDCLDKNIESHDASKFLSDEFFAYAEHFYPSGVIQDNNNDLRFKQAVHLHKCRNAHHSEFWAAKQEQMPIIYLIEMVCDWWSFSLDKNTPPHEIFDWYQRKQCKFNFSTEEKQTIEQILQIIHEIT